MAEGATQLLTSLLKIFLVCVTVFGIRFSFRGGPLFAEVLAESLRIRLLKGNAAPSIAKKAADKKTKPGKLKGAKSA